MVLQQSGGGARSGDIAVRHEPSASRFAARLGGKIAYLAYEEKPDRTLDFTKVFVPPKHRHRGIGGRITRTALEHAAREGYTVVPTCPYVGWYVRNHPEFRGIIAD